MQCQAEGCNENVAGQKPRMIWLALRHHPTADGRTIRVCREHYDLWCLMHDMSPFDHNSVVTDAWYREACTDPEGAL